MKTKIATRLLLIFLVLLMSISLVPMTITAEEPIIVIAGSDFQAETMEIGAENVKSIISSIKQDGYNNIEGFLFGGDYNTDYSDMNDEIDCLKNAVKSQYTSLKDENMIFIQGNHDPANSKGLAKSGKHDNKNYGVFVINEDDYMWHNDNQQKVKNTAKALEDYLKEKSEQGYKKPIFIASHLSLAYSKRTAKDGDGMYAKYIFDVLNKYGEGLNIIFLYGHNHNNRYDDYLGGSTVYLAKGDEIFISKLGDKKSTPDKYTLNFTYLNYGYVSSAYCLNNEISMTVFEIKDNMVEIKRYGAGGQIPLKTKGQWADNLGEKADSYGTTDDYLSIEYSNNDIVGIGDYQKGVDIVSTNLTDLKVELDQNNPMPDYYKAYGLYSVSTEGYTQGEKALIKIKLSDSFDLSKPVFFKYKDEETVNLYTLQSDRLMIEANRISSFELYQIDGIQVSTENMAIYKPVSQFVDGKNTLMVSKNGKGSAYALKCQDDGSLTSQEIEIKNGYGNIYISSEDDSIKWNFTHDAKFGYADVIGDLKNIATNRYLSAKDGASLITVEDKKADYTAWRVASNEFGVYTLKDNSVYVRYYVKYNDGFNISEDQVSSQRIYLFAEENITVDIMAYCPEKTAKLTVADGNIVSSGKLYLVSQNSVCEALEIKPDMLKTSDGSSISLENGVYEGLTLYYQDKPICNNFTLQIEGIVVNEDNNNLWIYFASGVAVLLIAVAVLVILKIKKTKA